MMELLSNPAVGPVIMVFAVPIVAVVAHFWHETLKTRSNNELKQSMVERGTAPRSGWITDRTIPRIPCTSRTV